MILHDLDLDSLNLDLDSYARGPLSHTMSTFNSLLTRKVNRLEILKDFPSDDEAEIIASLQVCFTSF